MKTFWSVILKGAMAVANYAAQHPDDVKALVKAAREK